MRSNDAARSKLMKPVLAALAAGIGLSILAAQPAAAGTFMTVGFDEHDGDHEGWGHEGLGHERWEHEGWEHERWEHEPHWRGSVVFVEPPVYYAPPPRVVYAAPVYAAPAYADRPLNATPASEPYRAANGQTCR